MKNRVFDLHSHSSCSDGALSPTELINRAVAQGVTHLALTDHDTLAGLAEARQAAERSPLQLINGVEISATWQGKSLHIIGLDFDPAAPELNQLLEVLQLKRQQRAEKIAHKLSKKGVQDPLAHAHRLAKGRLITRPHFAHCLVEQGFAVDFQSAFKHYLGQGKPAFVATQWEELESVVEAIHLAGGRVVIAHPRRYRMTHSWMRRLMEEFKAMGGDGVEVVCGGGSPGDRQAMTELATRYDLMASTGSDFHDPRNNWIELGKLPAIPADLQPIWGLFKSTESE